MQSRFNWLFLNPAGLVFLFINVFSNRSFCRVIGSKSLDTTRN